MKKLKYSEKYKYIILLVLLCFLFLMFRNNGWDRTEITLGQEIPDCGEVTDICYLSLDRKIYSYFSKFEWQDMPERR